MQVRVRGTASAGDGRLERVDPVGALPGELGELTTEVAVGSGLGVDRPKQVEVADDCGGTQVEDLADSLLDLLHLALWLKAGMLVPGERVTVYGAPGGENPLLISSAQRGRAFLGAMKGR